MPSPSFGKRTPQKRAGAAQSSRVVLPAVLAMVPGVSSLVEVGPASGASGEWLAEARRLGIADVQGIDGPWAELDDLAVDRSLITIADIDRELVCDRVFDLALCIEFAEHLPPARAASFVAQLCRLAPVVAFSAAIPDQGGHGHLNEQWPAYWEDLFAREHYRLIDALRPTLWTAPGGPAYVAQNLFLAVDETRLSQFPELSRLAAQNTAVLSLVHPEVYEQVLRRTRSLSVRQAFHALSQALRQRLGREVNRLRRR
jgi:hypothetical protein